MKFIVPLSNTHREIYHYHVRDDDIRVYAKYDSYRENDNDVWGDEWETVYEPRRQLALLALDSKHYPEEPCDESGHCDSSERASDYCQFLRDFNPCLHKTTRGETYLSGSTKFDPLSTTIKNAIFRDAQDRMLSFKVTQNG